MALQRRGEYWYGESAEDIRALFDRHGEAGDPIKVIREVICECGGTAFSVLLDDEYHEAAWFCRACDAQYLFHTQRVADPYEGDPEADAEYCHCPCTERGGLVTGGSYFELAVGVTLYVGGDDVDWVYLACRCVACGLVGYLAEWHRIEYPYPELLAHMQNRLRDE
jgi:hypothetical protein